VLGDLLRLMAESDESPLVSDLARSLGVSEGLVKVMIDDLVRRGYLAPVGTGCCLGGCSGCAKMKGDCSSVGCSIPVGRRFWALTDKGQRLLQPSSSRA
jgi:hypothetical protein